MTTEPERRTPYTDAHYGAGALFLATEIPSDTNSPLLPEKPALPAGLAITRRVRYPVRATGAAAVQARTVARPALRLILGAGDEAERLSRRIETCLAELVALAYTTTDDDMLLCSVWTDDRHVFLSVEHDRPLPTRPDSTTVGLSVVKTITDDYGTHRTDNGYETWAALQRH
ncbi:hypothetical protein AB0G49_14135 [Streptomyces longwoodensis]|uniref:hypothetical protein n=1 Tax=Streptomyces longwoodensis TaxID=68231 RepID=UPI0033EC8C2F